MADQVEVRGNIAQRFDEILTDEALGIRRRPASPVRPTRDRVLAARAARAAAIAANPTLDFRAETAEIRAGDVAGRPGARRHHRPPGRDHRPDRGQDDDQRAEQRRGGVHLADLEDAPHRPGTNLVQGQLNLRRRERPRTLTFDPPDGRRYALNDAQPRAARSARAAGTSRSGTSLVDGEAVVGRALRLRPVLLPQRGRADRQGSGPYFYLPKRRATSRRGSGTTSSSTPRTRSSIPHGTVRATVLIETIPPRSRWTRSCTSCAITRRA